ncbi:hypothetical protein PGTUg99_032145 [Puccinia graminis f. sp. tritici]|uniref:CxC1-like cysteine cluster associated with KDZ transposases domain-containing protein n=1 Tax=Puccinia graminis f. sp. tritici TaxID=56615 RepID=A0A5B0PK35_PUCGR|nr:hypothetical protein PGTUg99_032145 [Puccinia graminis f. sp. tritici]
MPFCTCIPDPIHFLAHGYLPSTPLFPQTGLSLRLLNFYDLLWNICNANLTTFSEVLRRWNESISVRLCIKETNKPRDLRRCLSGSVDAYWHLKRLEQDLIHTATSLTPQDVLAQQLCPACFGTSAPALDESQPKDTNQIFLKLLSHDTQRLSSLSSTLSLTHFQPTATTPFDHYPRAAPSKLSANILQLT